MLGDTQPPILVEDLLRLIRTKNVESDEVARLLRKVDKPILGFWHSFYTEAASPLIEATHAGRWDIVLLLLERGVDINTVTKNKGCGTALATAASGGQEEILSLLLGRGADINKTGGTHGTALATAAYHGKEKIVSLLLHRGADINKVNERYGTALATASYAEREGMVELLLDRGADIDVVGGTYGTALATAARSGRKGILSLLLRHGADINKQAGKYGTALATAAYKGHRNIVSLLLDRGADINTANETYGIALATAAYKGHKKIVSLLLDRGADIGAVGGTYGTALGTTTHRGHKEIVLMLLEHGADAMPISCSASDSYPSALDAARAEGSNADPTLLVPLETAIREQTERGNHNQPVDHSISRPPFPMPYTGSCRHKGTLPSGFSRMLALSSTMFRAGDNITPEQADIPCRELEEEHLVRSLAALVDIREDITPQVQELIRNDVRYFCHCNFDFGVAYAAARVAWKPFNDPSVDISAQRAQWCKQAQVLDEAPSSAIHMDHSGSGQELIKSPYSIMPRRLWDLKSHRVVEFRMLHAALQFIKTRPTFWAVSHSWTSDMRLASTSVNQHQWPVPLPKGISLGGLRSELLSLGAEYVWLDVTFLQSAIYILRVIRYFNGLGIPFSNRGWDDPRHWLQRAWTLQEIANENTTFNGGIPRDKGRVIMNTRGKVSGRYTTLRCDSDASAKGAFHLKRVAAAYTYEKETGTKEEQAWYLGKWCLLIEGELFGIMIALRDESHCDTIIYCDSSSAVQITHQLDDGERVPQSHIEVNIKENLRKREADNKTTAVMWIRAYSKLEGNEDADRLANARVDLAKLAEETSAFMTPNAIISHAKFVRNAWRTRLEQQQHISTWAPQSRTAYVWLYTNRGPINSWGKQIGKRETSICEWCWEHEETGPHIKTCENIRRLAGEETEEVEVEENTKKGKKTRKITRPREAFYKWIYSRFMKKFFQQTRELKEAGEGLEAEKHQRRP